MSRSDSSTVARSFRRSPPKSTELADFWLYFKTFLRERRAVASAAPSSQATARRIVRGLTFPPNGTLVELGAGTGAITAELLRANAGRCRVVAVERDAAFCARLRQRCPEAEVVEADALDFEALLDRRDVKQVDHVICGLPLNWLPRRQGAELLAAISRRLRHGGTLRQLTHLPWRPNPLLPHYFQEIETHVVWRNFPPAGFQICRYARKG